MRSYQETIRTALARTGHVGRYEPRHVEALMRCEHSTLDGLSAAAFAAEVEIARQCIDAMAPGEADALVESFGL